MPWALEFLHDLIHDQGFGWQGPVATVAAVLALLSGSDKLLSTLSGVMKKLAMLLIAMIGLLVPLLVILHAADFLVYGLPPTPTEMFSPLIVPVVGVIAILVAIPLGLTRRAFSPKDCAAVVGMLVAAFLLLVAVILGIDSALSENKEASKRLMDIDDPLERVAFQFDSISNTDEMDTEVRKLIGEFVIAEREYKRREKELEQQSNNSGVSGSASFLDQWWKREQDAKQQSEYFKLGQRVITLGDELSSLPPASLELIRREIVKLAHDNLQQELHGGKEYEHQDDVSALLRQKLIERHFPDVGPEFVHTLESLVKKHRADVNVKDLNIGSQLGIRLSMNEQQFPAKGTAWTQTGRRGNLGEPTENKDESHFLSSGPLPWEDADVYEGRIGATL